jgi:hypothetical protein
VITNVMEEGGKVKGAQVEGSFEGRVGVVIDMVGHGNDTLDVVPVMGAIIAAHVVLDI